MCASRARQTGLSLHPIDTLPLVPSLPLWHALTVMLDPWRCSAIFGVWGTPTVGTHGTFTNLLSLCKDGDGHWSTHFDSKFISSPSFLHLSITLQLTTLAIAYSGHPYSTRHSYLRSHPITKRSSNKHRYGIRTNDRYHDARHLLAGLRQCGQGMVRTGHCGLYHGEYAGQTGLLARSHCVGSVSLL
jgi:hypothetical protein